MGTSTPDIKRGLAGVIADTTAVSMVNPESNSLLYRGYPVQELAASCSFEEVAYLLWYGDLPNSSELASFEKAERSRRDVPPSLVTGLAALPTSCHPMDVLRTAVSILGANDSREDDASVEANLEKSLDLMAKLPAIVAAEQRRRRGGRAYRCRPRSFGFRELLPHVLWFCAKARGRALL